MKKTVTIIKTHLALAHRFYLGAREHDARSEFILDRILKSNGPVFDIYLLLRQGRLTFSFQEPVDIDGELLAQVVAVDDEIEEAMLLQEL